MIAIDTIAVENELADNMYQRSELDYLIYNDPIGYAELILTGAPETYLKTVTEYKRPYTARGRNPAGGDIIINVDIVRALEYNVIINNNGGSYVYFC